MARVHVGLDDDVVDAIDLLVGARGRSRFLKEAARVKLDRIDVEAAVPNRAGMLRDDDYPHWRCSSGFETRVAHGDS